MEMTTGPGTVVIDGEPYRFEKATVTTEPKKVYRTRELYRAAFNLVASAFARYQVTAPIRNAGPVARRNKPCPCGSKKKFKRCDHGAGAMQEVRPAL